MTEPDFKKLEKSLNVERTSWLSDLVNNPFAWLAGVALLGGGISYGIHHHHSTKRAQSETRITELEKELKDSNVPNLKGQIEQLRQKNIQLAGDYSNTQKTLQSTEEQLQQATEERGDYEKQVGDLNTRIQDKDSKLDALTRSYAEEGNQRKSAEAELEQAKTKIGNQSAALGKLTKDKAELEERIEEFTEHITPIADNQILLMIEADYAIAGNFTKHVGNSYMFVENADEVARIIFYLDKKDQVHARIESEPDNHRDFILSGDPQEFIKNYKQSRADLEKMRKLLEAGKPDDKVAQNLMQWHEFLPNDNQIKYELARYHEAKGNEKSAMEFLLKAANEYPEHDIAHYQLALLYKVSEPAKVIEEFRKAIMTNPHEYVGW